MTATTASRPVFQNLAHWEILVWYGLVGVSTAILLLGLARLVVKYRRGRGTFGSLDRPLERLGRTTRIVLTHAWIKRRDGIAGLAHAAIFYGFAVLFAGTVILGFEDDFAKPVLGCA